MLQPHAALSGPGVPAEGVAYVLDLPAVEQMLAHDLLIRQIVHSNQPVGVQLTEGIYVGDHAPWCVDGPDAENGEGQVFAQLPDVLLLRGCAEELLCCERHGEPAVKAAFASYALRLQQAASDLGLKTVSWARMSTRAMLQRKSRAKRRCGN